MIINHKAVPAKKQVYTELYTELYTKSVVKTGKEYKGFNKKTMKYKEIRGINA